MMLADPMLVDAAATRFTERRCNAEWALVQQMEHLVEQFRQIGTPTCANARPMWSRSSSAWSRCCSATPATCRRAGADGWQHRRRARPRPPTPSASRDHNIAGFVTDVGGPDQPHRDRRAQPQDPRGCRPAPCARPARGTTSSSSSTAPRGVIIVAPDEEIVEEYRLQRASSRSSAQAQPPARHPRHHARRRRGQLLANIEGPRDLPAVKTANADGIGLYRTEFLFIGRDTCPTRKNGTKPTARWSRPCPLNSVTIRTFDVGADKASTRADARGAQPALGLRAVRYSLARAQDVSDPAARVLRASTRTAACRSWSHAAHAGGRPVPRPDREAKAELRAPRRSNSTRHPHRRHDRGSRRRASPACSSAGCTPGPSAPTTSSSTGWRSTARTGRRAPLRPAPTPRCSTHPRHHLQRARAGLPVSVCGEMAGDPLYLELLLGMGLQASPCTRAASSEISSRSAPTSASSPPGASASSRWTSRRPHPRGGGRLTT